MIEDIINGISTKLYEVFGDDYKIYAGESIKQGLENPCFFISVLNPSQKNYLANKKFRNNPFIIQYFPKNEDDLEMLSVAELLTDNLEFITLLNGDLIRGTQLKYEIVDGILNFKLNYDIFIRKIKNETDIECVSDIKHKVGVNQ